MVAGGVEGGEEGVGATVVEDDEAGGVESAVGVFESEEQSLLTRKGGIDDADDEFIRQEVFLSARCPVVGMETCKVFGCEVDRMQRFGGTADGSLSPLLVEGVEYLLWVGDVVNAVGGSLGDGVAVPFAARWRSRSEALLEEERMHGAEKVGKLPCGGSGVAVGAVPRAVVLRQLRLEDIA